MSGSISWTTGEEFYSGTWNDIKEVLRVLNIGEGKMSQVTQDMVENYQEMVDRDIDALLNDTYHTPIRAFNMVRPTAGPVPGTFVSGLKAITNGDSTVVVSGASWPSVPTSVIATITMPAGGDNIFATVDVSTITANGFTATLSAPVPDSGYVMSYMVMFGSPSSIIPGGSASGSQAITTLSDTVVISGAGWTFLPTSVLAVVVKPSGGDNIFATVDASTITANGFTAILSAPVPSSGYSLSYIVMAETSAGIYTGTQTRVFPGDVRRAARYWTAGQLLVNEFQQLESNLTEQATQMVSDARMQVYAFSRPNHRIPGQRRKSNISHFLPASLQPSAFPERPS